MPSLRAGMTALIMGIVFVPASNVFAEGEWEVTSQSEAALERGLQWLARNQGPEGNWESNDLGLVGMGALAFLADGHAPGRGKYGDVVDRALEYIAKNARPGSGLLNVATAQRDMYNHGLATFVLGQAYGMSPNEDIGKSLDSALKLIANTQCEDGGWDYQARSQKRGHDLSLAVMQAKALRSAMDSGLEVPPGVIERAIKSVREHYRSRSGKNSLNDPSMRSEPGHFSYDGHRPGTVAMAAAGVVCMQEFGQYDDWRIPKSMDFIVQKIKTDVQPKLRDKRSHHRVPFDGYTLYYVGQALYQVGGKQWKDNYPILRDSLVKDQVRDPENPRRDGSWQSGGHVNGRPGELYGTAVACFILAMPNRFLPILQEGKIGSLEQFSDK